MLFIKWSASCVHRLSFAAVVYFSNVRKNLIYLLGHEDVISLTCHSGNEKEKTES